MNAVSHVIALAALVVLAGLSLLANHRLRHLRRLPMQWSLTGRVTWSAPRRLALVFLPVLAAILMLAALRAGAPPPLTALMALALIAAHLGHLWLAGRHAARGQP